MAREIEGASSPWKVFPVPSSRRRPLACLIPPTTKDSGSMMDVILVGTAVVFFAFCFAYTRACDRL
jgi:hypothetical protein